MKKKLRPIHGFAIILAFAGGVLALELMSSGWLSHPGYQRVSPDRDGMVRIDVSDLERNRVRFYRFLNTGNQEVKFLVGRDEHGVIQVGFDAGESHFKLGRGFSFQDGWIVDNKCETANRLSRVNEGGSGCMPTPVEHRVEGDTLVIAENDVLQGWRYFR